MCHEAEISIVCNCAHSTLVDNFGQRQRRAECFPDPQIESREPRSPRKHLLAGSPYSFLMLSNNLQELHREVFS